MGYEAACLVSCLLVSIAMWAMIWSATSPNVDAEGKPLKRELGPDPHAIGGAIEQAEKRVERLQGSMQWDHPFASSGQRKAARELKDAEANLARMTGGSIHRYTGGYSGPYPSNPHPSGPSRPKTPDDSKRDRKGLFGTMVVLTIVFSCAVNGLFGWGFVSIGLSLIAATSVVWLLGILMS